MSQPRRVAQLFPRQATSRCAGLFLTGMFLFSASPSAGGRTTCAADLPCPASGFSASATASDDERALELGLGIERELRAGETHSYVFRIDGGQYARLVVDQQGIDVVVKVLDGENRLVVEADRPNGMRGREAVSLIASVGSVYHVLVKAPSKGLPGRYEILLKEVRAATVDDSRRLLAERAVFEGESLRSDGAANSVQQAVGKFEQALQEWAALGERYEQAVTLYGLAWSFYAQGEFQKAAHSFEGALQLMMELDDVFGQAINNIGLGFAHINLGENEGALSHFSRAQKLHIRLDYKRGQAIALYGIGWVHALMGHDDRALETFLKLLPLRRATGDRPGEARTLSSIGDMYRRLGNYQKALGYLEDSLQILRELNDHYAEANTLSSMGWTYNSLAQYERALTILKEALNLRREVGDRAGEATTLYGIARTLNSQGDLQSARERIETALDIIESLRASGTSQELRTDYFALLADYYEFYVNVLMRLHGRDQRAGYDARALQASERARCRTLLDLLREAQEGIHQGVDPVLLERTRTKRRELDLAAVGYRDLLTAGNPMRAPSPEDAQSLTRQRGVVEDLTRQYQELESQMLAASPKYADQTQPQIPNAGELQRQLDDDTLLLEYSLGRERSYVWAVTRGSIRSYELPGRAQIEKATQQVGRLVVARTTRGHAETHGQWQARIKRADSEYWKAAAALSRMLLAPLASQPAAKRLVIVPQGALQSVPFEALPIPSGTSLANPSGAATTRLSVDKGRPRPLILDYETVILPSASALACLRRQWPDRKSPARTVAILADPVFSATDERVTAHPKANNPEAHRTAANLDSGIGRGSNRQQSDPVAWTTQPQRDSISPPVLRRLFDSGSEARAIMSLVRAGDGLAALDFDANHALAISGELSNYRIVHFATHALTDNVHPELSAIALSTVNKKGETQEGFLRANEIFNLKLAADLVVLSACRTGTGKEVAGEGLIGLTRPFMYAGAPRVIVSLWPLDDRATAELMLRFYKQLLGPRKPSPAAALRQAQIEMWNDARWRSPYYWGAFMLQGEWR